MCGARHLPDLVRCFGQRLRFPAQPVCSRGECFADQPRIVGNGVDEDPIVVGYEFGDRFGRIRRVVQNQVEHDDVAGAFFEHPLEIGGGAA